jgi:hypothetical protein
MPSILSKFIKPEFDDSDDVIFKSPYACGQISRSLVNSVIKKNPPELLYGYELCFRP